MFTLTVFILDFLSNKALNIPNLLYMREDFNIRDAKWNLSVSLHSVASQTLRGWADSYSLVHSILVLPVSTYYLNIQGHANTVIDLIF